MPVTTESQRRRRSSAATKTLTTLQLTVPYSAKDSSGASSGLPANGFPKQLPPISGTPSSPMSLSRSPSPNRGGGWSSPGLTAPFDNVSGTSSPRKGYGELYQMNGAASNSNVTWATAKARSEEVKGYPSFSTRNNGFFSRQARQISRSLPSFHIGGRKDYAEKEKLGRGRWYPNSGSRTARISTYFGRLIWRMRLRLLLVLGFVLAVVLFYVTRELNAITSCCNY